MDFGEGEGLFLVYLIIPSLSFSCFLKEQLSFDGAKMSVDRTGNVKRYIIVA